MSTRKVSTRQARVLSMQQNLQVLQQQLDRCITNSYQFKDESIQLIIFRSQMQEARTRVTHAVSAFDKMVARRRS